MRKSFVLLFIFILLGMYLISPAMELNPDEFMTVDEIKPGMKGVGKTVFEGTRIDEFQIEVLDISKNYSGPGGDVIWVLCSGGPLEETGVISGMSGSPVYIDGRMIGALAYRLGSFAKKPIGGVTPIADMLDIIDKSESETQHSMLNTRRSEVLASLLDIDTESDLEQSLTGIYENPASVTQIQMPVMISGCHPQTIEDMKPVFREFGMTPIQGGGASSRNDSEEVSFKPGSVVGVQYVRGDLSAYGYGTATYVKDGKFLAYGHPMSGLGKISLPVVAGRVGLLVPSMLASTKYVAPTQTIGTLSYDSNYGIMGLIDKEPEYIPLKIKLNSREYNFEIAEHRLFSPMYIFMTALNTVYIEEKTTGDYTMQIHSEIKLKGHPVISQDNVFSGASPGTPLASFAAPIYAIMQNRFEEVDMESIMLEISFQNERTSTSIEGIRIDKKQVRPGSSIKATVFLTPYMKDTFIEQFDIEIPEDMPEGPALLRISDAQASQAWEKARAPMKSSAVDLPHLIQIIQEEERNDDIIIELFVPKLGIVSDGQELPALPLTTFSVMNSRKRLGGRGLTRGTTLSKKRIRMDYPISGSATIILNIDRDA